MTCSKLVIAAVAALMALDMVPIGLKAKPVNYPLPKETAAFKPANNVEAVDNNCTACHSADYIQTQPRAVGSKREFWQAEVMKMMKSYGAPIDEHDVGTIVDYLSANY